MSTELPKTRKVIQTVCEIMRPDGTVRDREVTTVIMEGDKIVSRE